MIDMPNWIIYIAAIYALIFASTYLIVFQRLLRFALQDPNYEIVPKESIPPHLRELFQQKVADLQVLGFTFCCCLLVKPIAGYAQNLENQVLMYHRSTKTYAAISIRYPVESVNLFLIDFYTFFADKTLLMTVNGRLHSVIDEIPNTIANDPYAPTLEAQWRSHEDKLLLNEANKSIALPPEKFVQALEDLNRLYLDRMLQTQKIAQVADTEFFQLSWQVAWQTTVKLQRGIAKANQMLKLQREAAKSNPNLLIEVPIELEIESFYRVQQAHQGILKRGFGIWLLLGSLVLFAASFSLMQIPINLIILIGVVFFHEAGHYLTMRLCGYADTSVFFIPFFGAAATGRKQDASVRDKFLVLLGGPLPGLLIGSGLFLFSLHGAVYPDWLQETMFMLIGLNLFNLLPIYPLDGGKIVDLVFFSRYPFTDVLFKVIAVIALLALSLSSPLLIGLAVVVAITIPSGFRSAKLFSNLRTELKKSPTNDVNTLLATIFQAMRQFGHHNLPFAQRYNLAKTALEGCDLNLIQ